MNNHLNDTLPDLMRRATENLEPDSTDLVERGMRRGLTLRRRRTALLSFSGATAVLATAGIVITGTQVLGGQAPAPASGLPPAAKVTAGQTQAAEPVTKQETLQTLVKLLPSHLKVVKTETWGDAWGNSAAVIVDDGKGAARISLSVTAHDSTCLDRQVGCKLRRDGSKLHILNEEPTYSRDNNPGGILRNSALVTNKAGQTVSLISFNAREEKQAEKTRTKPILTVDELTSIADSKLWRFPPKQPMPTTGPDKPEPKNPGADKPAVPVQQTLQTLKSVLPKGLRVSQPVTWGGSGEGFNAATLVVDDGKGKSLLQVHVTNSVPVTECSDERSTTNCKVRPDGSVIGWTKEAPEYSDARQDKWAILHNSAQINYPDGRSISLTSTNSASEKDSKHTRPKPAFTTDQLLQMAGNNAWQFPGTGK